MNVQFLTDPHGELIWASPALPGSTHDLTAAREHGIIDALTAQAIACYADKGYVGAGGAVVASTEVVYEFDLVRGRGVVT